jgi:hypothetical protein
MRKVATLVCTYEAPIPDTIPIRYDTDTAIRENFQNSRYDTASIRY